MPRVPEFVSPSISGTKHNGSRMKLFPWRRANRTKRSGVLITADQTTGAVVAKIISILYREYCLARLEEMQRLGLTR